MEGFFAATMMIIIDNFCIALFSDVPKLTALLTREGV